MEELSAWTLELSRSLLAWWEMHGRRDPEQKPWMFTPEGTWPEPYEHLNPYPIHVAEVMPYSATHMASLVLSGGRLHGVGLFLSAGFHWRPGQ